MITTLDALCARALNRDSSAAAIRFDSHWFSWGEVRHVSDQLTEVLLSRAEVTMPVVAFVARNRPSALAAFLALLANRCDIRMLYPFQSAEALAREIGQIDPAFVVAATQDFTEQVKLAVSACGAVGIALEEMGAEEVTLGGHVERINANAGKPQVVLLTSGTTGPPKQFALDYDTVARYYTGASATSSSKREVALLYFPVSNISGIYTTLPPLIKGDQIVLLDRFNLQQWIEFVGEYRPEMFGMPPVGYKMLLDADVPREALSSIRAMGAGAAPLDPVVQRAFEERYRIPILLSYGATEFGGPVSAMTLALRQQYGASKALSVGKPLPAMRIRIVDPDSGVELTSGSEGVIEVVSIRIGGDWIRTSDLGVIDAEGFLFLRGRLDGAIMRGGFKVLPSTIETALLSDPRVAEVSVVGIPDSRLGQIPVAAVVLKPSAESVNENELERILRARLPATHIPVDWKLVSGLPRTPSMKVDLGAVRRMFSAR